MPVREYHSKLNETGIVAKKIDGNAISVTVKICKVSQSIIYQENGPCFLSQ